MKELTLFIKQCNDRNDDYDGLKPAEAIFIITIDCKMVQKRSPTPISCGFVLSKFHQGNFFCTPFIFMWPHPRLTFLHRQIFVAGTSYQISQHALECI